MKSAGGLAAGGLAAGSLAAGSFLKPGLIKSILALWCFAASATVFAQQSDVADQPTDLPALLNASQRIVFLGDSITYQGDYVAYFDTWLEQSSRTSKPEILNLGLPSETISGLSEKGHAGGRFPRPNLFERLDRVLEKTKPDLVIACYGMNCAIYQPLDEQRFAKFKEGLQKLTDRTKDANAQLILLTPPIFDDRQKDLGFSYNEVLKHYAEWMVQQANTQDWNVVDLHKEMQVEMESWRQVDPDYTLHKDGVHPTQTGHLVMANILINALEQMPSADAVRQIKLVQPVVKYRLDAWRDGWLSETGHQRPGIKPGQSLEDLRKASHNYDRAITNAIKDSKK